MAAEGVMADFARMPNQRKVLVFVVIGLMLGLLYWRFVFKPLNERVTQTQADHDQLVGQNRMLEADIPKYAALRQEMAALQRTIEENQKALPTESEVPAFFETLERKMTESGVEITKWTKGQEKPIDQFVKVPVDIEIVGTFLQLKRFFASLVQAPSTIDPTQPGVVPERERIVSIENLVLSQPQIRNREIVLSAKFTAVTFRQEDAAAKAPAVPAAPTPATKPLPPAGAQTPPSMNPQQIERETKARLEEAEKAREERVRQHEEPPIKSLVDKPGSARLQGGL